MQDGIYFEAFVVKDGVRYNVKIIDMKTLTITLTNSLIDGVNEMICSTTPTEKGGE